MHRIILIAAILFISNAAADNPSVVHIVALQNRQALDSAADAIIRLREGPDRDTLLLRQSIFENQNARLDNAVSALNSNPFWKTRPWMGTVWKVRGLLFSGAIDPLIPLLDTLSINPSSPDASWLLSLRLSAETMDPADFALRGRIESALYRHLPEQAVQLYISASPQFRSSKHLEYLCSSLAESSRPDLVYAAASACSDSESPDRYYYSGRALFESGQKAEGRRMLEKLLSLPEPSVSAQKARIYLSALNSATRKEGTP